jgi:hypothetical protein
MEINMKEQDWTGMKEIRSRGVASILALFVAGGVALSQAGCTEVMQDDEGDSDESMGLDAESMEAQSVKLQLDIADVLTRTPGARQISVNEIELAPGLHMKLPLPDKGTINVQDAHCPFQYLCAYQHRDFGGAELNFLTCGREWNLGNYAFPGGGWWNDKISSVINNQTPGTRSFFYNHISSNNWTRVLSINAGNYLRNLAFDTAEGGGNLNDIIDGVHVCGSVPSPWKPNWP